MNEAWELLKSGHLDQALEIFKELKDDRSQHISAIILNTQEKYQEAEICGQNAIDLYKWSHSYYNTLAGIKKSLYKYKEALSLLETANTIKPNCAETFNNVAMIYSDLKQWDKANWFYEKALSIESSPFIHFNYALCLLAQGNYEKGWEEYEWRKLDGTKPQLSNDLKNKDVLLVHEQGLGDTIQFIRYINDIKKSGAKTVNVAVPAPLERLIRTIPGIDYVNADRKHDLSLPIMSLPFIFKTIPNDPYIFPGSFSITKGKFNIGLACVSNKQGPPQCRITETENGFHLLPTTRNLAQISAKKRSINPEAFNRLLNIDIKIFSLQPDIKMMNNVLNEGSDFYDTASLISEMDLVISIDTSVAHLAGAMGKPIWLLLPYDSEWRWSDRNDSPWYPTMKIFRQKERGNWNSVLEEVENSIKHINITCNSMNT